MPRILVVRSANVDFTIAAPRLPAPGETVRHVCRLCDSEIQALRGSRKETKRGRNATRHRSRRSLCRFANWPFLSDPGRKLQKDLDIAEYTDPHHNPMIPHTLVLEPGLRVYKIYNGYWFFGRPTVEELRLDLRAVLQRCRPDWDISRAEQRTAWAKGEKASFFPYGKTQAQVLAEQD
jgi:hypothetical protein